MSISFKSKLKKIEKSWKQAEGDQAGGFKKLPDGKYKAILFGATIGESKNKENPRLQVVWDFRVTFGKQINSHAFAWDSLEDDRGMARIKGRLKALRQPIPKSPVKLPEILDNATETPCLIKLETSGTFQNLTILKRLKVAKDEDEDEDEKATRSLKGKDEDEEE